MNFHQKNKRPNSYSNGKNNNNNTKQSKQDAKCYACGKSNHNFKMCRYKSFKCSKCNSVGHIAAVCKKTNTRASNFLNIENVEEEQIAQNEELCLFNIDQTSSEKNNRFILKLNVNNFDITFEIDTGAAVSVCSKELYEQYFSNVPVNKSNIILKSHDGSVIRPFGRFNATVRYGDKEHECAFLIIENGGKPLIGRDILNKINFEISINSITNVNLDKLVKKYHELFDSKLGCYKYGKAKFEVGENTIPIFVKPRRVPLAFQDDVNSELDRLVREGVLVPIENSDWGTPIVPILKKDGKLRVCVDYKATINSHLIDVKFVVPNIDDIFAALCGGVYFSKLDLRNAYNQIEVDDASQDLLAWSTHKGVFACKRMSFGAKTACAIFQSTMSKVLQGCPSTVVFFDDILVTGRTIEEHLKNLENVFQKLTAAGFKLNLKKCAFFEKKNQIFGPYN